MLVLTATAVQAPQCDYTTDLLRAGAQTATVAVNLTKALHEARTRQLPTPYVTQLQEYTNELAAFQKRLHAHIVDPATASATDLEAHHQAIHLLRPELERMDRRAQSITTRTLAYNSPGCLEER
jgi:hypothetical protein